MNAATDKIVDYLIQTYALPGIVIIALSVVVVYLWREVKAGAARERELHGQINAEIKSGIEMAQGFRHTFDRYLDFQQAERRTGRGN
jgi:hypothetical protein